MLARLDRTTRSAFKRWRQQCFQSTWWSRDQQCDQAATSFAFASLSVATVLVVASTVNHRLNLRAHSQRESLCRSCAHYGPCFMRIDQVHSLRVIGRCQRHAHCKRSKCFNVCSGARHLRLLRAHAFESRRWAHGHSIKTRWLTTLPAAWLVLAARCIMSEARGADTADKPADACGQLMGKPCGVGCTCNASLVGRFGLASVVADSRAARTRRSSRKVRIR